MQGALVLGENIMFTWKSVPFRKVLPLILPAGSHPRKRKSGKSG